MPSAPPSALVPGRGTRSKIPALALALALLTGTATLLGLASGSGGASAAAADELETPFVLTLDELDTLTLNGRGPIRLQGTITNETDEAYDRVDVYPVVGDAPLTTEEELAEQTATAEDTYVGDRILTEGDFDTVEDIGAGETRTWSITLPRRDIAGREQEGVYWLGAHALIIDGEEVPVADGRVRTFLPRVSVPEPLTPATAGGEGDGAATTRRPAAQAAAAEQLALVLPLRRRVLRDGEGRLRHLEHWTQVLAPGGRLHGLLATGTQAGQLTWLVDPAVLDAVRQLAAGNPARYLGPTDAGDADGDGGDGGDTGDTDGGGTDGSQDSAGDADGGASGEPGGEPSPSEEPSGGGTEPTEELDEATLAAQAAARAWLEELPRALAGHQVLALPYGDPDIAAVADHQPELYATARTQGERVLTALGITAEPAVAPPSGYLDVDGLAMLRDDPVVLLSDQAVPGAEGPQVQTSGRTVVATSSLAGAGGPSPTDAHDPVALRQQAVAVAALRQLAGVEAGSDPEPVVVLLPDDWHPPADASTFLEPFADEDWLALATLDDVTTGWPPTTVPSAELVYPRSEEGAQVEASRFQAVGRLIGSGQTLERLLTRNDQVSGEIVNEALTSVSYSARGGGTLAVVGTQTVVDALLDSVHVEGPTAVSLASSSGDFSVVVVNDLDQPVTVELTVRSGGGMTVTVPEGPVQVPAASRSSFRLQASTTSTGVHQARLQLTDNQGAPVGRGDDVPIRTAQVSGIIWWFIGGGCSLLVVAIGVRLFRRLRNARSETSPDTSIDTSRGSDGTAPGAIG